ncbi:hypothetical protein GCM10007049_25200 [Echinicola pacifica]|uniref:FAD/NAD(P)-binding domain-containing protein n=1 Tax=Echinicola pacifica TaxID=346377 RepID=A0A918Q233_9BACT|nr:NAD(P)/FAD-dependent oxidoreductase [Echinicola pacifica]GGZ31170.1 hypothetical protein GCM10007049_25200 [Echinicola pacifica]
MKTNTLKDVIVIGGSYAGLSAGMALGRSLRDTLIIDAGKPCNAPTPHSHNFLTQDGSTPAEISSLGKEQVLRYPSVNWLSDTVVDCQAEGEMFRVKTQSGQEFRAKRILFTTGIKDLIPEIPGFEACWGKSLIHCPYCHGYEVKGLPTAIFSNSEKALHYANLLPNWTSDLRILTNGPLQIPAESVEMIREKCIPIIDKRIKRLEHENGQIQQVLFEDGSTLSLPVIYAELPFVQTSPLPEALGCALNEGGFISVNEMQQTTVAGIYAAGDNSSPFRAVSNAVAAGTKAGAVINFQLMSS